jgi:hypothetical protein
VAPHTLADVESAVRSSWSVETCDPVDVADWSPANPSRGQCGVTALTLHDLLGGELLEAQVLRPDGSRQGYHLWNRLAGGVEIDLTLEQFAATEVVQLPVVIERPAGPPRRCAEQYELLRQRVTAALDRHGEPA